MSLKEEQTIAFKTFVAKKDVFAVLPSWLGKKLIYELAPLVGENPVAIVVSPLVALMEEQIREAEDDVQDEAEMSKMRQKCYDRKAMTSQLV